MPRRLAIAEFNEADHVRDRRAGVRDGPSPSSADGHGRARSGTDPRTAVGRHGAREVVRLVQEARKNAGLDVTDRIELRWRVGGSPEPAEAIRAHAEQLAAEVLAVALDEGAPSDAAGMFAVEDEGLGLAIWLRRAG